MLYDRETDPLQLNNLINSTAHMDLAWDLTRLTHDWCRRFRDPFWSYKKLIATVGDRDDRPPIERLTDDDVTGSA